MLLVTYLKNILGHNKGMNYWIMKTEPDEFSIEDLKASPSQTSSWEGVRNYQARNFMRDEMKIGDKVLIYHSSCKKIGVAGIATVVKESYPDLSALKKKSPYYDPKSTKDEPRWYMIDIAWEKSFDEVITLQVIKEQKGLEEMKLVQKGNRLSIMPLTKREFEIIIKLA